MRELKSVYDIHRQLDQKSTRADLWAQNQSPTTGAYAKKSPKSCIQQ